MTHHTKKIPLSEERKKLIPKPAWEVFKKFMANGYEIYLVGAGVRNLLKDKIPMDCDFTTNASPEIIQALYDDSFYDNPFGTVGIPVKTKRGEELYEITPYRTEWGYSDQRRPDSVAWGQSLQEDLARRDFTFNAIVIGPKKEKDKWNCKSLELIDPFDGQEDFEKKVVRAVGSAEERFAEDALRMMRAIRFAAQLGFTIEEKTFKAICENAKLIEKMSGERIRDELFKILRSDHPYEGYLFLRNTGLAEIILPEVEKTFGTDQISPGRHHIYDVGTHSILSLKKCPSKDPIVRLAVLLHDVGKAETRQVLEDGTVTFYNHEIVSTSLAYEIGRRLRLSKKDLKRLTTLVRWHQFTVDENQTDKAIRRFIRKVGLENLEDMLALRTADRLGGGARETSWRLEKFKKRLVEVQKQPFGIPDLKINGDEVMKALGISPGPLVGRILQEVFDGVEDGKLKNEKTALLKKVKAIGKRLKKLT